MSVRYFMKLMTNSYLHMILMRIPVSYQKHNDPCYKTISAGGANKYRIKADAAWNAIKNFTNAQVTTITAPTAPEVEGFQAPVAAPEIEVLNAPETELI
ncbi:hypothetical protein H5410_050863 [Solanum commersonii]|uniref:Uncharacterized protein n=1 Tax=Solanum commersonii TaxID=4109 RepID=A0A9J5WYU9_SOLCO|nr:hypothetical protein H5410_050863 [Solanum commersonii]